MKTCRIMPDYNQCCGCIDQQITDSIYLDCKQCSVSNVRYEIVNQTSSRILRKSKSILKHGSVTLEIDTRRIFDIQDTDKMTD